MATQDILNVIEETISQFRPGGGFAKTRGQQLAEKRATVIPQMESALVKSGLGGTTVRQTIPTRFEQEIAKPFQTETDLLRSSRLMEAIMAKAGIMESAEQRAWEEKQREEDRKLQERLASTGGGSSGGGGGGYYSGGGGGGGGGTTGSAFPAHWAAETAESIAREQARYGKGPYAKKETGDVARQHLGYDEEFAAPEGTYIAGQGIVPAGSNDWGSYGKTWFIAGMSKEEAMKKYIKRYGHL